MSILKSGDPEQEMAAEIAAYESEQSKAPAHVETAPEPAAADAGPEQPEPAETPPAAAPAPAKTEAERYVPLAALHEERTRRQDMEYRLAEVQGQLQAITALMNNQNKAPQAAPEPDIGPPPDASSDPIGFMQWQQKKLAQAEKQLTEFKTQFGEMQGQVRETQEQQTLKREYEVACRQYAHANPQFGGAYQFLLNSRAQELAAYGMQPAAIAATVQAEELAMARQAFQMRRNPGEFIHGLAKARGYTDGSGQATQPVAGVASSPVGAGKPLSASPPAAVSPSAPAAPIQADPVQAAAQQQLKAAAATSIGKGGKGPTPEITAEALANMTGADFDKGFQKLFGSQKRSILS